LIGVLGDRDANVFFSSLDVLEQTKLNTSGMLGKDGKVDAVPHPRRTEGIGIAEESPYGGHNAPRIYPASSSHWQPRMATKNNRLTSTPTKTRRLKAVEGKSASFDSLGKPLKHFCRFVWYCASG
jgi:hypothetical protein